MSKELVGSKGNIYTFDKKDVLGWGSFGTVYKGIDNQTQQEVAIKALGDVPKRKGNITKYIEKAKPEIDILNQISAIDGVIKLIDTAKNDSEDYVYIILEYCEGGTLQHKLKDKEQGYLKEEDALNYIKQVAIGVQKLHEKDIMHRDISLVNVFLKEGRCKIGDSGSAINKKEDNTL